MRIRSNFLRGNRGGILRLFARLPKQFSKAENVPEVEGNQQLLKCCICYNEYGGYCIPLPSIHRPAARMLAAGRVYEPETIKYIRANSADGDIVHAGCFFGDFLPALSQACAGGAQLWAFEPNPENYRCARITGQINGLNNLRLFSTALGASNATVRLKVRDQKRGILGGASRILDWDTECSETNVERVEVTPLDEIIPSDRSVSILHLDVEGFELSALQGAWATIQRCRPILILETVPEEEWFQREIISFGYQKAAMVHGNTILLHSARPQT